MSEWIDVTRRMDERMICWPGRTPPDVKWLIRIDRGAHANVSHWSINAHSGTHMDAPMHFVKDGIPIDQVSPDILIGPCTVVAMGGERTLTLDELRHLTGVKRLLVRSGYGSDGSGKFVHHPALMTEEAAKHLVAAGLKLIGTERLTVDESNDGGFKVHNAVLGSGAVIIEALDLSKTPAGNYEMVAMPLKMVGAEASPARVMLKKV